MKTSRLIAAIRAGNRDEVLAALRAGANIEEADMHGHRGLPLRTACFAGNPTIVGDLIAHGADVNAPGSDGPSAPLRLARRRGHHDIFELLLAHGAHVPADLGALQTAVVAVPPRPPPTSAPSVPTSPPAPSVAPPEFTLPDPASETPLDDGDFGERTRLISMDLMFDEDEFEDPAPVAPGVQPVNADGSIDFRPLPRQGKG